jgi:hypothetical protein
MNNKLRIESVMIPPIRSHKTRRRLHRTFFRWLHDNQSRFLTPPFRIIKRTDRFLEFTIPGLNPALSFGLSTWELGVHVQWQNTWWDALVFFESLPEAVPNGYICHLCELDGLTIYASREDLWVAHDFEPFLEWVNTELTPTRWLVLNGEADASTSARLANEPDPESAFNLPVWPFKDN